MLSPPPRAVETLASASHHRHRQLSPNRPSVVAPRAVSQEIDQPIALFLADPSRPVAAVGVGRIASEGARAGCVAGPPEPSAYHVGLATRPGPNRSAAGAGRPPSSVGATP